MLIERMLGEEVRRAAGEYPVVTVTGPRQSGKTTLVRALFPDHGYYNLEHPEQRRYAEEDPKGFLGQSEGPVILDEIQRVPELLSWIQVLVDEKPVKGGYILTGSHQMRLHEAVSQSLAGRTSLLRLLPLSLEELGLAGITGKKEDWLHRGLMPRVYHDQLDPVAAYRNYFQTYVERDVRQLTEIRNHALFERFLRLLAGRVGQTVNLSGMSGEVGVSHTTLGEWLSILEASYILFRLPPYYRNYGKRLVKSPKIYFVEPGLACWLLGIETPLQASRDPLHGNLFENLVVVEALKSRLNRGKDPSLYFWRDSNHNEVDLLFERQRRLVPVEIKSSITWHADFADNIRKFRKTVADAEKGYVVYGGELTPESEDFTALPYQETARLFT